MSKIVLLWKWIGRRETMSDANKWGCPYQGEHYDGTDCGVKGYCCHACRDDRADARALLTPAEIEGAPNWEGAVKALHDIQKALRDD